MIDSFSFPTWLTQAHERMMALKARSAFEVDDWQDTPPLSRRQVDALSRLLGCELPSALREFLERAAAAVACRYTFEYDPDDDAETETFLELFPDETFIYGGPVIGPAHKLPDFVRSCGRWAQVFEEAGDATQAKRWREALPLLAVPNGDYVALDGVTPTRDANDPAVVYLSCDGEAELLAPSFTEFLTEWERLCYLGPEVWLLAKFPSPEGFISGDGLAATQLRRLFKMS